MEKPSTVLRSMVGETIEKSGVGVRQFESDNNLTRYSLRGLTDPNRPQIPSVDRAAKICEALGITLTIGCRPAEPVLEDQRPVFEKYPARPPSRLLEVREEAPPLYAGHSATPIPHRRLAEILARLDDDREKLDALRREYAETVATLERGLAEANRIKAHLALAPPAEDGGGLAGGHPVEMYELETAAGGGSVDLDHVPIRGSVWFRRKWLDRRGLDPTQCAVISVRGKSMEPTLIDGCSILVARHRTRRREGRVYVVWTEEGLIVKRARRGEDGEWMLISDAGPPDWPPVPWPRAAELKGEVIWTARSLVRASE